MHEWAWLANTKRKDTRAHAFAPGAIASACTQAKRNDRWTSTTTHKRCTSCERAVKHLIHQQRYLEHQTYRESHPREALREDIESGFANFITHVSALNEQNLFLEIAIEDEDKIQAFDWWPKSEVADRHHAISEHGKFGIYDWLPWFGPKKGPMYTAEALYATVDRSRVWIAAVLFSLHHDLPQDWYGPNARIVQDATLAFSSENYWSMGCRCVLPIDASVALAGLTPSRAEPLSGWTLGHIAALWATVCLSSHQLVRIYS
jgi:hypothetical protein